MSSIDDDVTMGTTIGASGEVVEFPRYREPLAPAKPFLMPSFDDKVVEILPSEKPNRKIRFEEAILVQEIENRFAYAYPEDDDEDSYEIEIVEDDGDADFYLEIVDGEVFYVFETEDDISEEESDEDMEESDTEDYDGPRQPIQLPIATMSAPNLDDDDSVHAQATNPVSDVPPVSPSTDGDSSAVVCDDIDENEEDGLVEVLDEGFDDSPETKQDRDMMVISSSEAQQKLQLEQEKEKTIEVMESATHDSSASISAADASNITPPVSPSPSEAGTVSSSNITGYTTPTTQKKQSIGSCAVVDQIPEPVSPIAQRIAPATPSSGRSTPARSILKACPESPKKPATPKKKKKKGEKKEKTYTKTYVRPEEFDGEHRVYSWEKPDWTKAQLKATTKGEEMRKAGNLANPITFPKGKKVNASLEEDQEEGDGTMDKEEIIRRLKGGDASAAHALPNFPGYRGRQRKLKFSIAGAKIRDGGDLSKPITKATVLRKKDDINKLADPKKLRSTEVGQILKEGKNLAAPVTLATQIRKKDDVNHLANPDVLKRKGVQPVEKKKYEWQKPAWAKGGAVALKSRSGGLDANSDHSRKTAGSEGGDSTDGEVCLKETSVGSKVFSGADPEKKKYEWQKPEWTKKKLGSTNKGAAVKQGNNLANPITFPVGRGDGINKEVKPDAVLRYTDKGEIVRQGDNLAQPITQLPDIAKQKQQGLSNQ